MRKMKDSGVAWLESIPETWNLLQLGSLFLEHKHKNVGMQSSNLLSLSYGKIIQKNINATDGLLPESFEGYNVIDAGDIVLRLTDLQNDQRSLRVGLCGESGIITSAYTTLRRRNDALNSKYFYYLLHSYDIRKGFYGMGAGVRQGLNYAGVRKIMLTVPPESEQTAIAECLDRKTAQVDALISNVQAQIEKLKAYKQSLITEVVTKGLDPNVPMKDSGVEWIGVVPKHWVIIPSKFLFENCDERRRENDVQLTASQKYGMISQKEYMRRENARIVLADKGLENWKHIEPFDFVISLRSFQGGLEMSEVSGCATWHYIVLRAQQKTHPYYYKWLFKSSMYITALQRTCNYIRDGQDLRYSNFVKVPLCIPTLEEQKQIADYLDKKCSEIDELIAVKQTKIEKLEQYKRSLIYEYVTGKKEVS